MSTAPEHEGQVRLARWVLASITACGACLTLIDAALLPGHHAWQDIASLGLALMLLAVGALAFRRAGAGAPGPALELGFIAVLAALAGGGVLVEQPLLLLGCAAAFLILATAPRVVAPSRVDPWTAVAVFGALGLGALELLPLPTRLVDAPAGPLRDLAFIAALVGAGALAVREFPRYPLKIKLLLVTLLVALAPLVAARVDTHLRLAARDVEDALSDMSERTARSAGAWDGFLAGQLAPLAGLAGGEQALAACDGDVAAREALGRELRRRTATGPARAAGLWGRVGQRVLAVGEFPTASPPPGAVALVVDDAGRDVVVLSAPVHGDAPADGCTLALALRPGLVHAWARAAATDGGAEVVVRDREDRVLFAATDDLAALLPDYAALPPAPVADPSLPATPRRAADDTLAARLDDGRFASVARIAAADWTLALVAGPAEFTAAASERARRMRWFGLLVAALASLAAFALSRRISAPIARLAAAMARSTGDTAEAPSRLAVGDEIAELARRFDLMAEQVGALLRAQEQQTRRLQAEVAERTEQERRLQALNRDLGAASEQAQAANRAKSTFLAHMSHELRTPLSAIIGHGEMVREQVRRRGHDDLTRDADDIVQAAQHLLAIINEILDLSKIEAGKMDMVLEEFDAARLAREVADVIRPVVAANRNRLVVEIEDDPAPMYSDRLKLRQALLNLLGNAAKFTEDGEVTLGLRQRNVAGLICLAFTVRDTGRGIPESAMATLFEPFTQVAYPASRKTGGTGLGLAITRRFCRLLGGEITVTSSPGAGSTFTITVPVSYRGIRESGSWRPRKSPLRMDETARIKL